ncbi:MAG TPA: dienelactone hydrolase family protein, partial [Longimicrobiales bacterium]
MQLTSGWVRPAGTPAYSARPAAASRPLPAVVVIQEVWGVDAHIRDLADRFAAAGYYAVAPDLFAGDGERPEALSEERLEALKAFLDKAPPAVWRDPAAREEAVRGLPAGEADAMRETMQSVLTPDRPYGRWLATLIGVADAVRQESGCTGRVMSTGYCLGGHLSALLAGAYPQLAAAAIYYG